MNEGGGGPYSFVLSGMNYHSIGSLLPVEGANPVYSQLYIFDTENEVANRISAVRYLISISFVFIVNVCCDFAMEQ